MEALTRNWNLRLFVSFLCYERPKKEESDKQKNKENITEEEKKEDEEELKWGVGELSRQGTCGRMDGQCSSDICDLSTYQWKFSPMFYRSSSPLGQLLKRKMTPLAPSLEEKGGRSSEGEQVEVWRLVCMSMRGSRWERKVQRKHYKRYKHYGSTDRRTDERTHPFIEMRGRI